MTVTHDKHELRRSAKARRDAAAQQAGEDGLKAFFEHLLKAWGDITQPYDGNQAIVAGYWPFETEMDVRPPMVALAKIGTTLCLPEVVEKDRPLRFRAWAPDEPLVEGDHGTFHPLHTAPLMRPDVVLVPLLAFDGRGYRIGWGGGYYDRTLEALRKTGPVSAVGVAYAAQEVDEVPTDDYDQPLDWIITERQARELK